MSVILLCTLVSVTDGDTFRADCKPEQCPFLMVCLEQEERIRIANIDAPETKGCPNQASAAKAALETMLGGNIRVENLYKDRYGRIVGVVTANAIPGGEDDMSPATTANVGEELVAQGFAKPWPHDEDGKQLAARPVGC